MHKTIELIKSSDGVYREGKTEPKQATLRQPKKRTVKFRSQRQSDNLVQRTIQELNDTLEEIGIKALNELTRGFFK